MGGLLSLVLPYNIFNLSSNRSLREHRDESPDILLAAIRLVDPRIAFYTQVSQVRPRLLSYSSYHRIHTRLKLYLL